MNAASESVPAVHLVDDEGPVRDALTFLLQSHGLAVRTVEVHRSRVFAKLGVRSSAEVATLLTRFGEDERKEMHKT